MVGVQSSATVEEHRALNSNAEACEVSGFTDTGNDMKQYLELLNDVVTNGLTKGDRTGTGTKAVFARQYRHNLADGFPLLTTKKLHFKSIANELIWMLSGNTNIKWLNENGVKIWDEWATEDGDLGPVYGEQWTAWPTKDGGTINQIDYMVADAEDQPQQPPHPVPRLERRVPAGRDQEPPGKRAQRQAGPAAVPPAVPGVRA